MANTGVSLQMGGRIAWLVPGDLIGRDHRCAFPITDERVSEAHALLSLRGAHLHLLNLRGGLQVHGRPTRDPRLTLGMELELAPDLFVQVVDLVLPRTVPFLVGPGIDAPLERTCSLVLHPTPHIVPGHAPQSAARFWHDGRTWYTVSNGTTRPLTEGAPLQLEGWSGQVERRSLADASVVPTREATTALRIEARYDTVQLFRGPMHVLTLGGIPARLVHELAELEGPAPWQLVARTLWSHGDDLQLRRRWDKTLSRLRVALRNAGVRDDLVEPSGAGQVQLLTYPGDEVDVRD